MFTSLKYDYSDIKENQFATDMHQTTAYSATVHTIQNAQLKDYKP